MRQKEGKVRVSERDQRLYRVLELTYLKLAPKQEAVADRLGLSFSTYRRHLTTAVDRLTEWLWRQEQGTKQIEPIAGHSTERAFMDTPIDHSDNIIAPTDVFQPATSGDTAVNELAAVLPVPDKPTVAILPFTNMIGDPDQATKRAIRSYPEYPFPYRWLAAALGQTGRVEEARQALDQALAIAPTAVYLYVRQRVPWMRAEDHAHMLEGLRKVGWRD